MPDEPKWYYRWPWTRVGMFAYCLGCQGGANWCLQTASAKGVYLTATAVLTFWVYCGTGTTLNPTSLAVSAPMTNVAIRRV